MKRWLGITLMLLPWLSTTISATVIDYDLVEVGTTSDSNRMFKKFKAVQQNNGTRAEVSVQEWMKSIFQSGGDPDRGLTSVLSEGVPYDAFYFETPPVVGNAAATQAFEFVLVEAPSLAKRKPRFRSFEKPCQMADINNDMGCVFPNLSGDATLIVAKPIDDPHRAYYTHLASFIRFASFEQIDSLWKMVAEVYAAAVVGNDGDDPVWLSTAGNGVPWLHFRLDSTPKYYRYTPYKESPLQEVREL